MEKTKNMETYVKVFASILDSTVWQESLAVKVVWITMLAMKDSRGYVGAAIPGLARRAGVSLEECEVALGKFLAPDPYSRSKEHDGRRIEEAPGGWVILNHHVYRMKMGIDDRREYQRIKQAEYRAKKKVVAGGKGGVSSDFKRREGEFVQAYENGDDEAADRIAAEGT